jgi:hypothetical protein
LASILDVIEFNEVFFRNAINLLNDPQSLAEKLFKKLRQGGEKFELKLLAIPPRKAVHSTPAVLKI